jgi:chaperonin GroES
MEPRLLNTRMGAGGTQAKITTSVAEYTRAPWSGRNESGLMPLSDKILVLVDRVEVATAGGVILTDDVQERANLGAESGVIVAMGPQAFRFDDAGKVWQGERPDVGTHVFFQRYSGQVVRGRDGRMYRTMDAQCIGAVALPDETADPFLDQSVEQMGSSS